MKRKQATIEGLLEEIGSQEVPGDHTHRYDLRRALLCSRYFEESAGRSSRLEALYSYTIPLIAGGVVVGVFTFMAISINPTNVPTTPVTSVNIVSIESVPAEEDVLLVNTETMASSSDYVSPETEPLIQLMDFETIVSREQFVRFIPVYPESSALVR
jgi:hypothetical protein